MLMRAVSAATTEKFSDPQFLHPKVKSQASFILKFAL